MKKHSTFQNKQRDLGRDLIIFHQFTEGNSAQFRKPLGYNGRKKQKSHFTTWCQIFKNSKNEAFWEKKSLVKNPIKEHF